MNLWLWFLFWTERFHWFWHWVGEGLDGQREKFWPWAEQNQGLLSVTALVTALLLFLVEQKRAIGAEARAIEADRKADLRFREENAENDRRLRLSIEDADRRSREQSEEADRRMVAQHNRATLAAKKAAAIADARVAEAKAAEDMNRRNQFVTIVAEIVDEVGRSIDVSIRSIEAMAPSVMTASRSGWPRVATDAKEILTALLPAAPPHANLILETQRTISVLSERPDGIPLLYRDEVLRSLREYRARIEERQTTLLAQRIATSPVA